MPSLDLWSQNSRTRAALVCAGGRSSCRNRFAPAEGKLLTPYLFYDGYTSKKQTTTDSRPPLDWATYVELPARNDRFTRRCSADSSSGMRTQGARACRDVVRSAGFSILDRIFRDWLCSDRPIGEGICHAGAERKAKEAFASAGKSDGRRFRSKLVPCSR